MQAYHVSEQQEEDFYAKRIKTCPSQGDMGETL